MERRLVVIRQTYYFSDSHIAHTVRQPFFLTAFGRLREQMTYSTTLNLQNSKLHHNFRNIKNEKSKKCVL